MYDAALAALEPLGDDRAARDLRASALSRAGATAEAAAIYRALAAEARGTNDGAAALYFAADAYQQGGDADAARPLYREVVDAYPGTRWAGLATMRLAGLAFLRGDYDAAAALWDRLPCALAEGRVRVAVDRTGPVGRAPQRAMRRRPRTSSAPSSARTATRTTPSKPASGSASRSGRPRCPHRRRGTRQPSGAWRR